MALLTKSRTGGRTGGQSGQFPTENLHKYLATADWLNTAAPKIADLA